MTRVKKIAAESASVVAVLGRVAFKAGEVSRETYPAKAAAFVAAGKDGWRTIRNREAALRERKPETPAAWVAWATYFDQIGRPRAYAKSQGTDCVPAEWPWEFSEDALPIEGRLHKLLDAYERGRPQYDAADLDSPTARLQPMQAPQDWKKIRQHQAQLEEAAREQKAKALGEERRRRDEVFRRRTFTARGIEPPELRPGEIGKSYDLMVQLGYEAVPGPGGATVMARRIGA